MKDKMNQLLKDKLFLVVLVLGLLTIVAAAGVFTIKRGNGSESSPYLEVPGPEIIAREDQDEGESIAGSSNADSREEETPQTAVAQAQETANPNEGSDLAAEAGAGREAAVPLTLNFTEADRLVWPVRGNVILDYSMDQTTYFYTLDQYRTNPGIVIQSDVSTPVAAPANARITEIGANEEIGNYVVMDLGNEYTATCGQLKEITAVEGEYLEAGQTIGYVSEPTKYYSVEGVNVFFELMHQGQAVDPLDYME